ncbi:DUF2510 domain-containing protein [Leifsonia aquatica]|uniref:DUF2510 domain-containing protein n=1 Tax=Leifsonia aquatica TaxID=144185 RepID=UPI001965E07C|nr:DUF2510 domain-containing protein [Leifsonia aquatica]
MSETPPPAPPIPAGWYADDRGRVRWWDGSSWTEKRAPLAQTVPRTPSGSLGLTGFVFACVAFAAALVVGVLGVLIGLVGVVVSVFGTTERHRGGRRLAIGGVVLSVASMCVGVVTSWMAWMS